MRYCFLEDFLLAISVTTFEAIQFTDFNYEFIYLITDKERWDLVSDTDGATLVNNLLELIQTIKNFDTIIFLASNFRGQFAESIIGKQVLTIEIGKSPIKEDVMVDANEIRSLIREIRRKGEAK